MMRQTLDARNRETALLSRGGLIDAGPFKDYVSDHDVSQAVGFKITLPGSPFEDQTNADSLVNGLTLDSEFRSEDGQSAFLSRQRISNRGGKAVISRTRDAAGHPFTVTSTTLPSSNKIGRPPREITALREGMRNEQPDGFLFSGVGGLLLPREVREDPTRWNRVQDWYNAAFTLYEAHRRTNAAVRKFLRGISYVGPLRSLPIRTYRLAAEAPLDVGRSGEFAPEVLYRLRDEEAGSIVFDWMQRLGYGRPTFTDLSDEYFQVQLKNRSGVTVNIADSGIGLSQLMPLLVQGAMTAPGATLIAQQPEIHLNPAQQSIATDFLIERASSGARVLIETHSEHVLLRLRRRVAEGLVDSRDVAIYYVGNEQGETTARQVGLGEHGEIGRDDWPEGFFEDQLEDSFALASAQSQRSNSK